MKYYIKTRNTKTNKSAKLAGIVFTSKKKAEAWAEAFDKSMKGLAESEVVKGK